MLEILLVEDNDDDARFIENALDKQKHHVKRITNGELGFHYLLKPDVEPDVVLLDYYLPLMNGLEIIKKTKERGKNYAFLFLTVDNTVEVAVKAMKAGALDFLPKTGEYYSNLPDMIDKIYKLQSSRKEKEKAETALRENESRLKEAERIAHLGNWEWDIINGDLRWSNEFYRILGIEPQAVEAAMETYMERVHPDDIEHVKKTVKEMARGHKSCSNLEHRLVRPDGSERFISGQITVYFAENNIPAKLFGTMLDITGRKRAEEALQARSHELALLNSAGRAFVSSLELDQVLTTVLNQVRQIIGIVACCIWLVDPKSGDLVCREAASPRYKIVRGWRLSPGQDLAGWVIQHGESLNVPDIRIDRRHFKGVDKQTDLNLRSILGVPLQTKHGVFGVLQLVDEVENRFSPDDVRLAESLAMLAA
ncbi:MAG: response regulator, partial [bacterium]|nr:response regulator [bacterium]